MIHQCQVILYMIGQCPDNLVRDLMHDRFAPGVTSLVRLIDSGKYHLRLVKRGLNY
jgi:hypothetical protein